LQSENHIGHFTRLATYFFRCISDSFEGILPQNIGLVLNVHALRTLRFLRVVKNEAYILLEEQET
jgi:hypothetical protein